MCTYSLKVSPYASLIFVFDPTALPAQITQLAVLAIWAGRAVGSKTKIKEASGTTFSRPMKSFGVGHYLWNEPSKSEVANICIIVAT